MIPHAVRTLIIASAVAQAFVVPHRPPHSCSSRAVADDAEMTAGFRELVGDALSRALSNRLSVVAPNEIQARSLALARDGRDIVVVAQTGSGKTLTFLLPAAAAVVAAAADDDATSGDAIIASSADLLAGSTTYGNPFSGRAGFAEIGVCMCEHDDAAADEARAPAQPLQPQQPVVLVIAPTPELAAQHAEVAAALLPRDAAERFLAVTTPERLLADVKEGRLCLARVMLVSLDEADAVLCGAEFDGELPAHAAALLAALPLAAERRAQVHVILTTAYCNGMQSCEAHAPSSGHSHDRVPQPRA